MGELVANFVELKLPRTDTGEVRVKVTLTNAGDETVVRRGMAAPESIRRMEVEALVDTGAVNCVLPEHIADALGLARPLKYRARYADGRVDVVDVTEPVLFDIEGRKVYEECLVLGDTVLLGQTALESTDLFVDCGGQRLVGNPDHPNEPILNVR